MSVEGEARRSITAVVEALRARRPVLQRAPPVPRVSRLHAWAVAAPCCVALLAALTVQAVVVRTNVVDRERLVRAIGAAPAGPDNAASLRLAALQRFTFQQRYLRSPTGAAGETVAWSPDGTRLVTGSGDGTIALWRVTDGHRLWTIDPAKQPVAALAWSPDGQQLIAGSAGSAVLVLDAHTARIERRLPTARYIAPAMAYAPNGRAVAVASGRGEIALWSIVAGRLDHIRQRLAFGGATTAVGWSPDGRLLAVGGLNGALTVWDTTTGQIRIRVPAGRHGTLWSLQWSRTGRRLALGWADGTVRILAGPGLVPVRTLRVGGAVNTLSWSADGTFLAVTAVGRAAEIWDTLTGTPIDRIDTGWDTNQIAWSADGRSFALVTDGHDLRLWQATPPTTGLGGLICRIQSAACAALDGPRTSVPSYMGR
ncbi:MAG TPA: WD40 repeat domain-containing protein [Chloroflexota bacterium]|nr:WD40 repeat domain-containing protein [Chloroflexota bacterium]